MPNFKLTINVNLYALEVVVIEADDREQAEAALKAYLDNGGPFHENLETYDWEVVDTTVDRTDDPAFGRAAGWLL